MEKIRVLIVDDSPEVVNVLHSILSAYSDIEVVGEAADGYEGISKVEELQPWVVLMDIQMPGMDGIEATRHIKVRFPDVKVLALLMHTGNIEVVLAAGADCCVMKDSSREDLLLAIREVCHPE